MGPRLTIAMSAAVEAPNPAKEHLLHRDDSSDGVSKPQVAATSQETRKNDSVGTVKEPPLRRYWVRPLVAILVPSIVSAYYGVIWIHLIQGVVHDEVVGYRTFSGSLIFYSWFIIGVFGLSWSKYGLVGVEASMLRTRFWSAPNLVALLMHSNSTWSSPSGWLKAIMERQFYRLWSLLTFISFLPFIALPLSGLVFEISDGYVKTSDSPSVQGRNEATFNMKYHEATDPQPALMTWQLGPVLNLPGMGVIYTNQTVDRSSHSDFAELPNTFPLTESIPDLFLAPQADRPVSGEAWGLRIKYDCSTAQSASQLKILSEKPASWIPKGCSRKCSFLSTPSGNTITFGEVNKYNVRAYFEVGVTSLPPGTTMRYNGSHPDYEADEGNTSLVFEYAAWQYRTDLLGEVDLPFDTNVGPTVQGMGSPIIQSNNGSYILNTTFFTLTEDVPEGVEKDNRTTYGSEPTLLETVTNSHRVPIVDVAGPIAVRCVVSSGLGIAELDGMTSTFRNYRRSDPVENVSFNVDRFGFTAKGMLDGEFYQHYISSGLPGKQPGNHSPRYLQFLDSDSLLRSVSLAYAMDAFDLMYGVSSGYKAEWPHPTLTSSREGKILTVASLIQGDGVGYFVLALLILWAALSAGLSLFYGFRRRPADRLDGYTMLRKGADLSEELKENEEFMSGKPVQHSRTLKSLPGS